MFRSSRRGTFVPTPSASASLASDDSLEVRNISEPSAERSNQPVGKGTRQNVLSNAENSRSAIDFEELLTAATAQLRSRSEAHGLVEAQLLEVQSALAAAQEAMVAAEVREAEAAALLAAKDVQIDELTQQVCVCLCKISNPAHLRSSLACLVVCPMHLCVAYCRCINSSLRISSASRLPEWLVGMHATRPRLIVAQVHWPPENLLAEVEVLAQHPSARGFRTPPPVVVGSSTTNAFILDRCLTCYMPKASC